MSTVQSTFDNWLWQLSEVIFRNYHLLTFTNFLRKFNKNTLKLRMYNVIMLTPTIAWRDSVRKNVLVCLLWNLDSYWETSVLWGFGILGLINTYLVMLWRGVCVIVVLGKWYSASDIQYYVQNERCCCRRLQRIKVITMTLSTAPKGSLTMNYRW